MSFMNFVLYEAKVIITDYVLLFIWLGCLVSSAGTPKSVESELSGLPKVLVP